MTWRLSHSVVYTAAPGRWEFGIGMARCGPGASLHAAWVCTDPKEYQFLAAPKVAALFDSLYWSGDARGLPGVLSEFTAGLRYLDAALIGEFELDPNKPPNHINLTIGGLALSNTGTLCVFRRGAFRATAAASLLLLEETHEHCSPELSMELAAVPSDLRDKILSSPAYGFPERALGTGDYCSVIPSASPVELSYSNSFSTRRAPSKPLILTAIWDTAA